MQNISLTFTFLSQLIVKPIFFPSNCYFQENHNLSSRSCQPYPALNRTKDNSAITTKNLQPGKSNYLQTKMNNFGRAGFRWKCHSSYNTILSKTTNNEFNIGIGKKDAGVQGVDITWRRELKNMSEISPKTCSVFISR